MQLDDTIPKTNMTYKERIELAVGDKRGNLPITDEFSCVMGGTSYATERIFFWTQWNDAYKLKNKFMNTQKRYIEAQMASDIYATAVYKSLVSMFTKRILEENMSNEAALEELQEFLFVYMGGSLRMMQSPLATVKHIIMRLKIINTPLSLYLDMKFKKASNESIKRWVKNAA